MHITINNTQFNKEDLIELISKSKLKAIKHITSKTNIGLKDAHSIVENLNDNPNYYDHQVLDIAEKDFSAEETITINEEPTFIINKNLTTNKDAFTFKSDNKLAQIKQIKESLNVDLKTAQKIVEELHEKMGGNGKAEINFTQEYASKKEISSANSKDRFNSNNTPQKKTASHIIKNNNSTKKWIYLIVLLIAVLLFYILKTNSNILAM
ncbi:hypothetical protein MK851_05495 [Tenacibaculum sp. 1B UA]|uniref:hypothetical protein n=1 Tax=Tenacibaculum sp. 1B UA TaxID=2922252 RepID=UPI002A23A763|nr:hypothetical protein [Tenacibaculum sp. 1B UA]MDX8553080.1 hypothetical protein [Tenacibaculum sp. 1B UA]